MPLMCDAPEEAPAAEAAAEPAADDSAEDKPARRARAPRAPKTKLEDLVTDVEIQGTVRSVQSYGAFVDIGAATDGLLHVSEISNEFVKDATEKLNVGDAVTVRVKSVNLEKNQVALTAKDERAGGAPRGGGRGAKADISEFVGKDDKEFITAKVSRIQEYGAFIELKPGVDGLVHISEIQDGGVSAVADVLKEGQEVQVRIINVDEGSRRIGLSMRPWVAPEDRPQRGKRERRGRDDGEDDEAFKMSSEELEGLVIGEEADSVFDSAFVRMEVAAAAKKEGKTFAHSL